MDRLYSVAETAERLGGISVFTVHSWLSKGHPKYGRLQRTKVGSRTFVTEQEILRYLSVCNQQPNTIFPSSTGSQANPAGGAA